MGKKQGLILIYLTIQLLVAAPTFGTMVTLEKNHRYEVEYDDFKWYQKFFIFLIGYDFLDWEEIELKEIVKKDTENNEEKLVGIVGIASNGEPQEILNLKNGGDDIKGFIKLINLTEFKKEEVIKLLMFLSRLQEEKEEEFEFKTENLFDNEQGNMRCKIVKKKIGDKYLVNITTLNSKGDENAWIEIIMNPCPEKYFENINAKLKIGPRIILTIKNPPEIKKPQ